MDEQVAHSRDLLFFDTFTSSLFRELRGTNVHVSVVRPGAVRSAFFDRMVVIFSGLRIPVGRLAVSPEAVADRISKLLRQPARFAYVPRILGIVPWIEMMFGWLIDRLGPLALRWQLKSARGG